jgi:H+/Cl- antiporter ClcA
MLYTKNMKRLQLLATTILVGIGVALTYHYFEEVVRESIDHVWDGWLNTGDHRLLLVPLCFAITLIYFGVQHYWDPGSEKQESHGLGDMPRPSVINFVKILVIGFLSLLTGASLGPEAILVPACMMVGGYCGARLFHDDKSMVKLLSAAGFVGLFAAFFNSFFTGLLAILLVTKQARVKLNAGLLLIAALASASTVLTLKQFDSSAYTQLPAFSWGLKLDSLIALIVLVVAGYGATYGIGIAHDGFARIERVLAERDWWQRALVAAVGLSALYLAGGSLVEFTGNQSVLPMLGQAASLGFGGLLWIVIVKVLAISWSKAIGYRGGLIFPSVFVASVLVAMAHTIVHDINFIYGIIAVMAGLIAANAKVKILF